MGQKDLSTQSTRNSSLEILSVLKNPVGQLRVTCPIPLHSSRHLWDRAAGKGWLQTPADRVVGNCSTRGKVQTQGTHVHGHRSISACLSRLSACGMWIPSRYDMGASPVSRSPLACCLHRTRLSAPSAHIPGWPHWCPYCSLMHCPIGPSAPVLSLLVAPWCRCQDPGVPQSQAAQPAQQQTEPFLWLAGYSWATAVCWRCHWLGVNGSDFGIHFWNWLWRNF